MQPSLIEQHWMWMFGMSSDEFASPLTAIAHRSPFFEDYNGAWIFEREGRWVVTVPSDLRDEIASKIVSISESRRLTEEGARELFKDRVLRIIGPVYQGALEPSHFKPFLRHSSRLLLENDRHALEELLGACDSADVDYSGVDIHSIPLHCCYSEGRLVAVAKEIDISPYAMNPGVLVHPAFRGQGYGKAAVSATVESIFAQGRVVSYQTLANNVPSVGIAQDLGCKDYARHLAVRLRN